MIYISKACGSCRGVTNFLKLVYEIYEREIEKEEPKNIVIYKDVIHNSKVEEELKNLGISIINDLDDIDYNDIVIIPFRGENKETINFLEKNNIEYYNATCSKILKIYKNVLVKYQNGYEIIIVGNPEHALVQNILSWCDNKGLVLDSIVDVVNTTFSNSRIFVVVEPTFAQDKFLEITNALQEKFINVEIIIENTLCKTEEKIYKNSLEIAEKCDLLFVVGDKTDIETKAIFTGVSRITNSYQIENIAEFLKFLLNSNITSTQNIGITGGIRIPVKEIYNYKYLLSFIIFYKEKMEKLKIVQGDLNNNFKEDNNLEMLNELMSDFCDLNSDGKYLSGVLIALGYYLASEKSDDKYTPLSLAYEMFQTSILIHDDIIDNAKSRRGKNTIPRRICQKYLYEKNDVNYQNNVLVLANSLGICAGDLGFYWANKIICNNFSSNANFPKLFKYFNEIVIKTIKGEILDVIIPFRVKYNYQNVKEEDVLKIYHLKTSFYTIIGPFFLGCILGGKEIDEKLESILNKMGIVFQIKKDIFKIFSNSKISSDIEEFKQTILYTHVINTNYKDEFLSIYGKKNITEADLIRVQNILIASGTLSYANDFINNLNYEINEELNDLEIKDNIKDILKGLVLYINIKDN